MSDNIDPENLGVFSIPEAMLQKLFEFSGDADHSKGFILAYVDQNGKPMIYTKSQNQIIEMGLRKALDTRFEEPVRVLNIIIYFVDR